jgi:hypothetical protein
MREGDPNCCRYCGGPLDMGSEFVYLVEAQRYDELVAPFDEVQASPHYHGEPLRTCERCRESIEQNREDLRERDAWEAAQSRLFRKVFAFGGLAFQHFFIVLIVIDVLR